MEKTILNDYKHLYNAIKNSVITHKSQKCNQDLNTSSDEDNCAIVKLSCDQLRILDKADFGCFLTIVDSNSSDQQSYLTIINEKIQSVLEILSPSDNEEDPVTSVIDIKEKSIKNRITAIQFLSMIFYLLIIYIIIAIAGQNYIAKFFKERNSSSFKDTITNGMRIIIFCMYLIYIITHNKDKRINKLKIEIDRLEDTKQEEISNMKTIINRLNSIIKPLVCDENIVDFDSNLVTHIDDLSTDLNKFIELYNKLDDVSINNHLLKETKVKEINLLFNDIKSILYVHDNKFSTLVFDNSEHIYCLMNLLLVKDECDTEIKTIKCSLNNKCGLKGLFDVNSVQEFNNGLNNINQEESINILHDKFKKEVFNQNTKFELLNLPLFKTIVNIFIFKIHNYNLDKKNFVKYIYRYFDKIKLSDHGITIDRFDLINNYKSLINIIYNEYDHYKKLENGNKIPSTIIEKSRFYHIIAMYNNDQLNQLKDRLNKTIDQIKVFKKLYKNDIYEEINNELDSNLNIKYFSYSLIAMTANEIFGDLNKIRQEKFTLNTTLQTTMKFSLYILFNSIIASHWYKTQSYIEVRKMILTNSDSIFERKLDTLQTYIDNIIIINNIDNDTIENNQDLINLLNSLNIIYSINAETIIYSKLNSSNNYSILDSNDIRNIVYNKYYIELIEIMRIYECCSFLVRKHKINVFPWTELSINIILYSVTGVILFKILSDKDLNPINIINKYKIKKTNMDIPSGGNGVSKNEKHAQLLYIIVTLLSLYYSYNIYYSTFEYQENLFK